MLSLNKRTTVLLFTLALFFADMSAQSNPWTKIRESEFANRNMERSIVPQKYLTYALDKNELDAVLWQAPLRFSPESHGPAIILQLPMPDGTTERFQIFDAPIMHADLARRYPMIHAYAGVGLDDPTATLRFDITQFGLHATILSGRHSPVYIDPYSRADTPYYITYYKSDYQRAVSYECLFDEEHAAPMGNLPVGIVQDDCSLRTYRLALACTSVYADFHGGNKPDVMAALHTTMTRVNGIFERDVAVSMMLIANNDELIFIENSPYSDETSIIIFDENQMVCDQIIGTDNYDIGHVFAYEAGSVALGGAAYRSSACLDQMKASAFSSFDPPIGDPFDIDFVAHEMGHQFGCSHTASNNCNSTRATSVEPSDASTIMGQYFCDLPNIQPNNDAYFHALNILEIGFNTTEGPAGSCPELMDTGNTPPEVSVGQQTYVLPISTPFKLDAVGQDADGEVLTYCWEQMDNEMIPNPPQPGSEAGPAFRSYEPAEESFRIFPALEYIINGINYPWEVLPAVSREMDFRVTVRDNFMGAGCTSEGDIDLTFDENAGPFVVQSPNSNTVWYEGASYTVSWDVAKTDVAPVSCTNVDILLSLDGGYTYPVTLAIGVPNDGSHVVEAPGQITSAARVMIRCSDNIFFDLSDEDFEISIATEPAFSFAIDEPVQKVCSGSGDVVYSLLFDALAGFNEEINLTAAGLPASASFNFSNTTLTPPATVEFEIDGLENVAPGNYVITIKANSPSASLEQEIILVLEEGPAETIQLIAPVNGATLATLLPTFSWSAGNNNSGYTIEIATSPGFGRSTVEVGQVSSESYTPSENLSPLTVYYWRVRSTAVCTVEAANTPWFTFQTGGEGCYTYTNDDPVYIHGYVGSAATELSVENDLVITDVNAHLEIFHKLIGDLSVSLTAPSGTAVELFDRPGIPASGIGCTRDNMLVAFDDESSNTAAQLESTCINGQEYGIEGTFQPTGQLASFNGQSSAGIWTINVSDDKHSHAGSIDNWSLELCFDQSAASPPAFSKADLTVPGNGVGSILSDNLQASTPENSAYRIMYTILTIPFAGNLNYNGTVATIGTTFSQADIDNGLLSYTNTNPGVSTDQFRFDITTPQGGWIQGESLNINIGKATSVMEQSLNIGFDLFPNPSTGALHLSLHQPIRNSLTIQVYGLAGKVIHQVQAKQPDQLISLNLNELPAGIYTIVVSDREYSNRKKWVKI